MVERKYNNIQIADNIVFSESINGIVIDGEELVLKGNEYKLLLCLVKAQGRVVSQDIILETVWGPEYNANHDAHMISDVLKSLRKRIKDDNRTIIVTLKNTGYKLSKYIELEANNGGKFPKLPIVLSQRTVPNVGDDTVIFREEEVKQIVDNLNGEKNSKLLLYGFGGVGKTSVARLVYETIHDKYDSTGWIEYHINMKNSIVEGIDFVDISFKNDANQQTTDAKWFAVSNIMKNSKEKKLIIVDNVDVDHETEQNPMTDLFLTEITGWTNTDIILTSRLPVLKGYHSIQINNLGDADNREKCVALFVHYYAGNDKSLNNDTVGKIVELAGFNTMVIELLAKSCVYEHSIEDYYEKLKTIGFSYPSISVMTMHENNPDIVSNQISNLFNIKKRSKIELAILVSFRLLPEGESITKAEVENWLGFPMKTVDSIVKEGWIKFKNGLFSIHPLIRQSFTINDNLLSLCKCELTKLNNKVNILSKIKNQTFFDKEDDFELSLRKLVFADCLYSLSDEELEDAIYIGDQARKLGRRDIATKYYKLGYDISKRNKKNNKGREYLVWKTIYYYGYLLSYTKNGMKDAEEIIRKSLDISKKLYVSFLTERSIMVLAASYDHLGYILYNDNNNEINRMYEARECLEKAISLRLSLCEKNQDNMRYLHDLAWSQDNIGCLLTELYVMGNRYDGEILSVSDIKYIEYRDKAEKYLRSSLDIRRNLAFIRGNVNTSSEVAWTCCNLARCISCDKARLAEAETIFKESIDIYNNIERNTPGYETASLARSLISFGKALYGITERKKDRIELFDSALNLYQRLEKNNPGVYSGEIASIKKIIAEKDPSKRNR